MPFVATVGYLLMQRNNALESTSSSSDEEWNAILRNRDREKRKLRARIADYESVINRYSDEEFKRHFRSVCDRFNVGRATAVRAVRRVCHALFIRASRFIQWPTGDHAVDVMRGFERSKVSLELHLNKKFKGFKFNSVQRFKVTTFGS
ncbi:hypothetical protein RN001_003027 [Aquatica leii]|uniref:Uncharacterized protein n=1 Tax=Aquatica leii TaxID=1421715 RepID=A0AAN7SDP0_9COLE|nr:hypothetical protein RN001_003027 [Aquatica leii]